MGYVIGQALGVAGSGGGTVYECASLISSVIGIVKNARKDKENGEV